MIILLHINYDYTYDCKYNDDDNYTIINLWS